MNTLLKSKQIFKIVSRSFRYTKDKDGYTYDGRHGINQIVSPYKPEFELTPVEQEGSFLTSERIASSREESTGFPQVFKTQRWVEDNNW